MKLKNKRKTIEKICKITCLFFRKDYKIDKPITILTRKEELFAKELQASSRELKSHQRTTYGFLSISSSDFLLRQKGDFIREVATSDQND